MKLNDGVRWCLALIWVCLFVTTAFCDSSYDRELIVKDKTRAMQVENTFKELMAAYEDEDAQGFLDLVSDERFRQDYMTFTDALYSDFRTYEIRQVDYWIDRVVPDHIKQFLYVRWEKRYEDLDDGQQFTTTGYSRFLFDEVDGQYLLIELAGDNLFGGSLPEWVEDVPHIPGQKVQATATPQVQGMPDLVIRVIDLIYTSSDATVYYEVENTGTATSATCQVEALYSEMSGAPASASGSVASLTAGETRTGLSLYLPNYYSSGVITVDSTQVVSESNETNNSDNF
jgi:hypothetical protein